MSGEFIYILNNNCFHLFPGFSAYAPALFNPGAGNGSLKWSQHQFIILHEIKSDPQPIELLF